MAMNNNDRINKAFQLLSEGLADPVDAVMTGVFHTSEWADAWAVADAQKYGTVPRRMNKNDVQVQLRAITEYGREFNRILSRRQQAYASELRDIRNEWAHMETFSSGQTLRALDTIELLLDAVNAPDSAADVRRLHDNLQRTMYESHTRSVAKRKSVSIDPDQGMKAWREVVGTVHCLGVRRRPVPGGGLEGCVHQGQCVWRPGRVLQPHVPDRGPQGPAHACRQTAHGQ